MDSAFSTIWDFGRNHLISWSQFPHLKNNDSVLDVFWGHSWVFFFYKNNFFLQIFNIFTKNWGEVMLKLNLQCFGQLMWRIDSLEKTLMLGKIEDRRRRLQRMRRLHSITDTTDRNPSKLWEIVKDRESWHAAVHGVTKSWTWVIAWATTTFVILSWWGTSLGIEKPHLFI